MNNAKTKPINKNYKSAEMRLLKIINKIETMKLSDSYISQLEILKMGCNKRKPIYSMLFYAVIILVLAIGAPWVYSKMYNKSNCLLELPSISKSVFRPPEDCSMCTDVNEVVRLTNTTPEDFQRYAYSTTPVIVVNATTDWKALKEFDFNFFAKFYNSGKMGKQINDCFYFAYKSGLNSLQEVFDMDEARANLSGKPWYVGWSTCHEEETRQLRTYYNRPYFLPETAESDMVDWIFMGGPGQGAHMHVDSVKHMSWQAQVRGRKQWQLAPPPECLYRCRWITFTVSPGEILVVDTNRWYHKTNVLPGDISITIGAEYD